MSFLKITDPERRDKIVKEFLEMKKNIQESQLRERAGKRELKRDIGKFFKPVTEAQKETVKEIKEELQPLKEIAPAIAAIPGPVVLPALPANDSNFLGKIAERYLKKMGEKDGTDKTFGIYSKKGNLCIGDKRIVIVDNNIFFENDKGEDRVYEGSEGLWELIMSKDPDEKKIYREDFEDYINLMIETNAVYQKNDPEKGRPKASGGKKYNKFITAVWDRITGKEGSGISDPNKLIERLDLLMESKKAGNTGVQNEIVSICDNLKKQNILNSEEHKKILTKC